MLKVFFSSFSLKGIIAVVVSCVLIIVLTIILFSISNSKKFNPGNKQLICIKNNIIYRQGSDVPMTGKVIDTVNSRIIEYDVVNGLKNGVFKIKFTNGKIAIEGFIKDNKNIGEWKYYYPNGQLESKGYFDNDIAVKKWVWYYMNGKIKQEGVYSKGLREGEWSFYNDSGIIQLKVYFHRDNIVDKINYLKTTSI